MPSGLSACKKFTEEDARRVSSSSYGECDNIRVDHCEDNAPSNMYIFYLFRSFICVPKQAIRKKTYKRIVLARK